MSSDALDRILTERAAQGLPPKVEDPAVLARVATLLANSEQVAS